MKFISGVLLIAGVMFFGASLVLGLSGCEPRKDKACRMVMECNE